MNKKNMMHTRGIVIGDDREGFAQVIMDRRSACSGCETGVVDKCTTCLTGERKIQARVRNPKNAHRGDLVEVSISSTKVLKGAALFYMIPVISLLLGALVGQGIGNSLQLDSELSALLCALAGLAAGFYIVRWIYKMMNSEQDMMPEITEIIHSGKTDDSRKVFSH